MEDPSRQLAVIMFTDIVGYTTLMGESEVRAFTTLGDNRRIHRSMIHRFNGRLLKDMGDGMLVSFTTVSDAVFCAGAILQNPKFISLSLI